MKLMVWSHQVTKTRNFWGKAIDVDIPFWEAETTVFNRFSYTGKGKTREEAESMVIAQILERRKGNELFQREIEL